MDQSKSFGESTATKSMFETHVVELEGLKTNIFVFAKFLTK